MILNGWREIAQHFGRGVRTVQRWEQLGLPVRRPNQRDRSAVVAYSEELDDWMKIPPQPQLDLPCVNQKNTSGPFKRRILLVDDDEGLLVTAAAVLMNAGNEVRTARDGFEALAALRLGVPDILISDLRMPGMSGFELLAVVRRRFPSIGVIAISGEFTPAAKPAVLADCYIEKGVNSVFELVEAVRELLTQVPLRGQPAKPDSAPAWIPRSANGYVVLTCLECLRSFSVAIKVLAIDEVGTDTCVHCGQNVRYRIDETVLPAVSELPDLLQRAQKSMAISREMIMNVKNIVQDSKQPPANKPQASAEKTGTK